MMPLFHESVCHGLQPAWNPDRPRRPVNALPAPATVLAVAALDSPAYAPGLPVFMLNPNLADHLRKVPAGIVTLAPYIVQIV
jgi:hypothetical protein